MEADNTAGQWALWLGFAWFCLGSVFQLWWGWRDSKKRWAEVEKTAHQIHDQSTGQVIRELHAFYYAKINALAGTIGELRIDLARAGRALMAHPQGHAQDLIDDALEWVADDNVVQLFEVQCEECAKGHRTRVRGKEWRCSQHKGGNPDATVN